MKTAMNKKTCNGTYTVEAALIFPIIFFIILLILNLTFYCYDRDKLHSEMSDIVGKASRYLSYETGIKDNKVDRIAVGEKTALSILFEDRQPKERMIKQYISDRLKSGYYVMKLSNVEVSTTFSSVRLYGTIDFKFYGLSWMNHLFRRTFTFNFDQSARTFPREEKARLLEAAISAGIQIKGVEDKIDQLAKFIGYIH